MTSTAAPLPLPLPDGVRSRVVPGVNGLAMHVLEAGHDGGPERPLALLLHGFPELAYSWRHVLPALAAAGFHAVAPDQRGYGRSTGWSADYDDPADLDAVHVFNLVRDQLALVGALGRRQVQLLVGHDFGSPVAAWAALIRPDVFRCVVLMSSPFAGAPRWPWRPAPPGGLDAELAALPRPRQHYQTWYATRHAEADLLDAPQGLHQVLRAYYHMKSADWPHNRPAPLPDASAASYARLPTYYVMEAGRTMAQTVAPHAPTPDQVAACRWLADDELAVYTREFTRTGLQGGLQWYRSAMNTPAHQAQLGLLAGRRIEVPALFVAGAQDWGTFQRPGAFEAMATEGCADFRGAHLIDGAGHWVQQERPDAVVQRLLRFAADAGTRA